MRYRAAAEKIMLAVFGLLVFLITSELSLRAAGGLLTMRQERLNRAALESGGDYRILCLGESTTARGGADSWPVRLEDILNSRLAGTGRTFAVFNKAREGTTTSYILSELDKNLERYQPHMVVAMMGINDDPGFVLRRFADEPLETGFWGALKIVKVFLVARERLRVLMDGDSGSGGAAETGGDAALSVEVRKLLDAAWNFRQEQDNANAREKFERVLALDPDNIAALTGLSYVFLDTGEYGRAELIYRRLMDLVPDLMHGFFGLGNLYMKLGRYVEAIEYLLQSTEREPANGCNYIGLIHCYARLGDYKQAERWFRAGVENSPRDGGIYIEYCNSGVGARDNAAEKLAMLSRAIEVCPPNYELFCEAGDVCMQGLKDYGRAEEMFLKAIDCAPLFDHYAYISLVELYKLGNRPERLKALINDICAVIDAHAGRIPEQDAQIDRLLGCVLSYFRESGDSVMVGKYTLAAEKLRARYWKAMTRTNYLALYERLSERGIPLVCVQYPMRDLSELESIFARVPGAAGRVLFVDNKAAFSRAVEKDGYDFYFTDNFAGDFGHATRAGNALLAGNIADVLIKSGELEG